MKAVVLAGGKGTRLAPYTSVIPKPLMPIGDMPILDVLLHQMQRAGVDEIVMAVGHLDRLIRSYFGDGSHYGIKIRYSKEEAPLGTAGPLALIDGLDEPFLVVNGDTLSLLSFKDFVQFHNRSGAVATIATNKRRVKIDLGVLKMDDNNLITSYAEKPNYDYQASMGIYMFEPAVKSYIPTGEYFDFPNLVLRLLEAKQRVAGYPFDGYWMDLGRPDDYHQAILDFAKMRNSFLEGED